MAQPVNPYLQAIAPHLPRIWSWFDEDPFSPTYGVGDRYYWAWKLIDFPNGTFQGLAHGLARLYVHELLPDPPETETFNRRLDAMLDGTIRIQRGNGSYEEAFPYESSYCVTALVAFDYLSTVQLLQTDRGETWVQQRLSSIAPAIRFLERHDEHHAMISNHLATAVAALTRWHTLSNEPLSTKATQLRDRIVTRQHNEGWFNEYGGADPGYQTLALYYLAEAHKDAPELDLMPALDRACAFLTYFAHPDGSFSGHYSNRNTRFLVPGGVEALAEANDAAAQLAQFARDAIGSNDTVSLAAFDAPNFAPNFNAYCLAAVAYGRQSELTVDAPLPWRAKPFQRTFDGAGIHVRRDNDSYTIVGLRKGGVVYHFRDDQSAYIDYATILQTTAGRRLTTQADNAHAIWTVDDDVVEIETTLRPLTYPQPAAWKFALLRLLSLTVMRMTWSREMLKKMLVRLLIDKPQPQRGTVRRRIRFAADGLDIDDQIACDTSYEILDSTKPYAAIHMASQGYWQRSDHVS